MLSRLTRYDSGIGWWGGYAWRVNIAGITHPLPLYPILTLPLPHFNYCLLDGISLPVSPFIPLLVLCPLPARVYYPLMPPACPSFARKAHLIAFNSQWLIFACLMGVYLRRSLSCLPYSIKRLTLLSGTYICPANFRVFSTYSRACAFQDLPLRYYYPLSLPYCPGPLFVFTNQTHQASLYNNWPGPGGFFASWSWVGCILAGGRISQR